MTPAGTFYWEHLGLLGSRKYEWTWREIKRPTYEKYQIMEQLVTTDEKNGINPDKIRDIINAIVSGDIKTEDEGKRYSLHHYSLR